VTINFPHCWATCIVPVPMAPLVPLVLQHRYRDLPCHRVCRVVFEQLVVQWDKLTRQGMALLAAASADDTAVPVTARQGRGRRPQQPQLNSQGLPDWDDNQVCGHARHMPSLNSKPLQVQLCMFSIYADPAILCNDRQEMLTGCHEEVAYT